MSIFRTFAVLLALVAALVAAPRTFAGNGAVTETIHEHGATETFTDIVPCGGEVLYDITITYNLVEHSTFGPKSIHLTFAQTGTFVAVPQDASLPTYTGHFTQRGGFNGNNKSASGNFTFSVHGTGSDGSKVTFNAVEHFNINANGVTNEFSFENCH